MTQTLSGWTRTSVYSSTGSTCASRPRLLTTGWPRKK